MPIKLPSFRQRRDAYPPDLWTKCPSCSEMLFNKQLEKSDRICPTCDHHFRLSAAARLALLLDPGTFQERDAGLQSVDPLDVEGRAAAREDVAAAWAAVGRLPADRRRAIVLRFVDEMSTAEIAGVLGRSENAVRVLIHRALRSVARDLGRGRAANGVARDSPAR